MCNGYFDAARYLFDMAAQIYTRDNVHEYWQANHYHDELTLFGRMGYDYNDAAFVKEVRAYAGTAGMAPGYRLPVIKSNDESIDYISQYVLKKSTRETHDILYQRDFDRRSATSSLLAAPEIPLHVVYASDEVLAELYSIPPGPILQQLKVSIRQIESQHTHIPPHRVVLMSESSRLQNPFTIWGHFILRSTDDLKDLGFSSRSNIILVSPTVYSLIERSNLLDRIKAENRLMVARIIRVQDVLIYPNGGYNVVPTSLETTSELTKAKELLKLAHEHLGYYSQHPAVHRSLQDNDDMNNRAPSLVFNELMALTK